MAARSAGLMRWVERATLDRVDLVVVLSQEMKDQLRRIGVTAPIDVVPLWVDTDEIQAVEPATRPRSRSSTAAISAASRA